MVDNQPAAELTAEGLILDAVLPPELAEASPRRRNWWRSATLVVPLVVLMLLVVLPAVLAPWLAPHDPREGSVVARFSPPAWEEGGSNEYLLGTDSGGRDVLSRVIYGGRTTMIVAGIATLFAAVIGVSLGCLAGYYGGIIDAFVARSIDIAMSIPALLFALVLAVSFGPGMRTMIATLVVLLWSRFARQMRAEALALRSRGFVDLARVAGLSGPQIIVRHLLPNMLGTLTVITTLEISAVILLEASLSFLGVGLVHPTPAWGLMVSDGREHLTDAWWLWVFPGLAILLVVLSLNLLGDWCRDRWDPHLVHER
jgi:peptide/nickel transport system permease protein